MGTSMAKSLLALSLFLFACGDESESTDYVFPNLPHALPVDTGDSPVGVGGNWKLIWHDEFDVPGAPDPQNWGFETGFVRNNEAQWYTKDQARVDSGALVITADKISAPNQYGNVSYISASLTTSDDTSEAGMSGKFKQSFFYGVIEAKMRIPTGFGAWPALWALNTSFKWPEGGEIDIMEYYRGDLLFNVMDGRENWNRKRVLLSNLGIGWDSNFHIWTMEWNETKIDLYLDGALINHYPLSNADQGEHNPFKFPFFLVLNLALGGTSGGDPSGLNFPIKLEVDWIRAFTPE